MVFIGIIEADKSLAADIIQYFFGLESYSVLFCCADLEAFKALPAAKRLKTDVVMLDSGENNFDRLWQIKFLRQSNPDLKILLFTEAVVTEYLSDKLKEAGADCFIQKENLSGDLEKYFNQLTLEYRRVGRNLMQPTVVGRKIALTERELEIVGWVARGLTNRRIGEQMRISTYTVNAHMRKIFVKCAVNSRRELIIKMKNELAT
jgi:two-component system, NarL family, response regulator